MIDLKVTKKNKFKFFKDYLLLPFLFISVLAIWYSSYEWIQNNVVEDDRGVFGDQFGAINALFSALAFAGIIYTIIMQKEELKLQREELKETRKEFTIQNETLRKQRFENTFFQMLTLYNRHLSKINSV